MVIQPKPYNQAHFTVDFECFTHDLCRSVGATQSPKLRKKQLFESFFNFEKLFSDTAQKNTKITFFLHWSVCRALSRSYKVNCQPWA